ncbi:MAG: sugar phosphate isomerase/epimerase [Planctomycetota bacterium]
MLTLLCAAMSISAITTLSQPVAPAGTSKPGQPPATTPTAPTPAAPAPFVRKPEAAMKLGWTLGTQAWTFRDRTLFETIDTAKRFGLTHIEFFNGQKLSKETGDVKVGPELSKEHRDLLKKKFKDNTITANSYGVIGISKDEKAARANFDFAKDMGLVTISCEPEPDALDLASKLADEYKINLAIHDHPKPSRYWNADIVLDAIKGRSSRMGACADTGHWTRSGLTTIEQLKKLEGHIIELHFKDVATGADKSMKDKPWGTGDGSAKEMLAELKRQNFKGVILVEYEDGSGPELEANVAKCIDWFDKTAAELAAPAKK